MDVEVEEREEGGADYLAYSNTEKTEAVQFSFLQLLLPPSNFICILNLFSFFPIIVKRHLFYLRDALLHLCCGSPSPLAHLYRDLTPLIMLCLTHAFSFSLYTHSSCKHTKTLQPLLAS